MRKMKPNSAKNADVIETLAALKRRLRKIVTGQHRVLDSQLPPHERGEQRGRRCRSRRRGRAEPTPLGGLDDREHERGDRGDRRGQPSDSRAAARRASFDSGTSSEAATSDDDRRWERSRRRPSPTRSARAASRRRSGRPATAMPLTALQMPIAFARSIGSVNVLVRIASVAGKMSAAPTPMRAGRDQRVRRVGRAGQRRGGAEDDAARAISARLRP